MKYGGIIFGFDGTLVNSVDAYVEMVSDSLPPFKFKIEGREEEVTKRVSKAELKRAAETPVESFLTNIGFANRGGESQKLTARYHRLFKRYEDKLSVFKGINTLIKTLKEEGKRLFILTSGFRHHVERILGDLEENFEAVHTRNEGLPDSIILSRIVAENKGLNLVYVDDQIRKRSIAKGAGVPFVWAKYGFQKGLPITPKPSSKENGEIYVVESVKELEEFLTETA